MMLFEVGGFLRSRWLFDTARQTGPLTVGWNWKAGINGCVFYPCNGYRLEKSTCWYRFPSFQLTSPNGPLTDPPFPSRAAELGGGGSLLATSVRCLRTGL